MCDTSATLMLTSPQGHMLAMQASRDNCASDWLESGLRVRFLVIHSQPKLNENASYILQMSASKETCAAACRRLLINLYDKNGPVTLRMLIETAYLGNVIGRGGVNIKTIQFNSGARVRIVDPPFLLLIYDQSFRVTTVKQAIIIGKPNSVGSAIKQLLDVLSELRTQIFPSSQQRFGHWPTNPGQFADAFLAARRVDRDAQRLAGRKFNGGKHHPHFGDCWTSGLDAAEEASDSYESVAPQLNYRVKFTCFYSPAGVEVIKAAFWAGKAVASAAGHELSVRLIASPEYHLTLVSESAQPSDAVMSAVLVKIKSSAFGQADGCEFRILDSWREGRNNTTLHLRQHLINSLPKPAASVTKNETEPRYSGRMKNEESQRRPNLRGPVGSEGWLFAFDVRFAEKINARIADCLSCCLDECYC